MSFLMVTAAWTKPEVRQDSLVQGIREVWRQAVCFILDNMAVGSALVKSVWAMPAAADKNSLHILRVIS